MNILLTGGAGYIGTHTTIELLSAGHTVVIIDNLSNSSQEAVRRVEKLLVRQFPFMKPTFVIGMLLIQFSAIILSTALSILLA